jgi:hypothetical protein
VVATDGTTAGQLLPGIAETRWYGFTTWYFHTAASVEGRMIVVDDDGLNTVPISNVAPEYSSGGTLLAASLPGVRDDDAVIDRVARVHGLATGELTPAGCYRIPHAVPAMPAPHHFRRPVSLGEGRYVCGDHRDSSSLQGAMASGRRAAAAVLAGLRSRP